MKKCSIVRTFFDYRFLKNSFEVTRIRTIDQYGHCAMAPSGVKFLKICRENLQKNAVGFALNKFLLTPLFRINRTFKTNLFRLVQTG